MYGPASAPKLPRATRNALRTSGSGSPKASSMSSMQAAPLSPMPPKAVTAATRTFASASKVARTMSAAYIWPRTPIFSKALMTATRTWPQRSWKHFRSFSMCEKTPSPMLPRARAALLRTPGCWRRSNFTTSWIVEGMEPPCALPIEPTALAAADTTRTSLSSKRARTSASCRAPSAPMAPNASAAATRTSAFPSDRRAATLSACLQPSGPILASACAAAHLGMHKATGGLVQVPDFATMLPLLSSNLSPRRAAMSGAKLAAFSPISPNIVAAAAFSQPALEERDFAMSFAMSCACSPRADKAVMAALRTITSSSAKHLQIPSE
mmetsp:Transcript_27208/g.62027  ORF Transcript_27208/g.62027 Transcript_27208/m.62027 type:complete len:324 (-) Transcript_27208:664-1635(-)